MPTIPMPLEPTRNLSAPATEPAAALSPLPPAREQVSLRVVEHQGRLTEGAYRLTQEHAATLIIMVALICITLSFRSNTLLYGGAMATIVVISLLQHMRGRKRPASTIALPLGRAPSRLTASGRADELQPVAELTDVPFEPVIFTKVVFDGPLVSLLWILLFISTCFGNMGTGLFGQWFPILLIVLMLYGIPYLLQRFVPTYYRIVPGRLDVLRGSFLRSHLYVRHRYDLRTANIEVIFKDRCARLTAPRSKPVTLPLSCIDEPYRFVESLFRAAVCTHPAPPVPDDALLG